MPDIHQDNLLLREIELQGDAEGDVDGNRVQMLQFALKLVQPERRMLRIHFQYLQRVLILRDQIRMLFDKASRPFQVAFGVDDSVAHCVMR